MKMLKKLGIVLLGMFVISIVAVLLNWNTIQIVLGKGDITMKSFEENQVALTNNSQFENVTVTEEDGQQVLSAVSKDKQMRIKVVSQDGKIKMVESNLDASSLNQDNIKDVLTKNFEGVLSSVMDKQSLRGIELYVAKEALQQYQNNNDIIVINKTFGNIRIQVRGDIQTAEIQFNMTAL